MTTATPDDLRLANELRALEQLAQEIRTALPTSLNGVQASAYNRLLIAARELRRAAERAARAIASKMCRLRNSVVVCWPANCGSASRFW